MLFRRNRGGFQCAFTSVTQSNVHYTENRSFSSASNGEASLRWETYRNVAIWQAGGVWFAGSLESNCCYSVVYRLLSDIYQATVWRRASAFACAQRAKKRKACLMSQVNNAAWCIYFLVIHLFMYKCFYSGLFKLSLLVCPRTRSFLHCSFTQIYMRTHMHTYTPTLAPAHMPQVYNFFCILYIYIF